MKILTDTYKEAHELLDEEPYEEEMEPGRAWRAPDGTPIVKTLEHALGSAGVLTYTDQAEVEYDGSGTDMGDPEGVIRAGNAVFLDEGGDEWLECELIKDPAAPLPDEVTSPWLDEELTTRFLAEKVKEVEEVILGEPLKDPTLRHAVNNHLGIIAGILARVVSK